MATPRSALTMVRLLDGRVLVVEDRSAEVYDPATGTWSPAGMLSARRFGAGGSLLPDGKVLISYGASSIFTSRGEISDPATNSWSPVGDFGDWRLANPTVTRLPNNSILFAGGVGASAEGAIPQSGANVYDPGAGAWHLVSPMAVRRRSHAAVLLPAGNVLVTGGEDKVSGDFGPWFPLDSTEIFNPPAESWAFAASMMTARFGHGIALLPDGRVLVAGGYTTTTIVGEITATAEVFNPTSNTWGPAEEMSTPRAGFETNRLPSGQVLVAGGETPSGITAAAELFDPATHGWTATGAMNARRARAASVVLLDGRVLIAGGSDGEVSLSSAEIYTPCAENAPPVAVCADRVASAGPACSANASADNGSYDPDHGPGPLQVTQEPAGPYGLGDHLVTLTASDGAASASCQATVTVVDDSPPTAGASRGLALWPPNHRLRRVSLSECAQDASDNCTTTLSLAEHAQITRVTSNEPVSSGDVVIVGPATVDLRAERLGASCGRVYTISYSVTDLAGNATAASCTVSVPHDPSGAR